MMREMLPAVNGIIPAIIPTIFPAAAGPAPCASTRPAVAMKNVRNPGTIMCHITPDCPIAIPASIPPTT
jgi:hypothetical protein